MILGLSVFTESSGRSCHKLRILSVLYWWFSTAKPPKILTLLPEKDKLYYLYAQAVFYTVDNNLEMIIFCLFTMSCNHWHWSFLTDIPH